MVSSSEQNQLLSGQLQDSCAVMLPGAGFDDYYLYRSFAHPCQEWGIELIAHRPCPGNLIEGYLKQLQSCAYGSKPLIVGGISIGALVAIRWAFDHVDNLIGVMAVLPPWTGPAEGPAALSARYNAAQLRDQGLQSCISQLYQSCPQWLAQELSQSWTRQWPLLPQALEQASYYSGPSEAQLSQFKIPVGIVGAPDDRVHPFSVARQWSQALPYASLVTTSLDHIGRSPAQLGKASLQALWQAMNIYDKTRCQLSS